MRAGITRTPFLRAIGLSTHARLNTSSGSTLTPVTSSIALRCAWAWLSVRP